MKSAPKLHILEQHYLDFYSRALSILNDEDDAKDAVQEAVVKTLVRVGVHDVVAYCYRATEHECVNIIRRRRKRMSFDELSITPDVAEEHLKRDLRDCKSLLLPMERKVLELRREYGYNSAETGARLRLSVSSVKRLLASAENKIKNNMLREI